MARRTLNVPAEALEKYEEFHRHAPKQVGKFAREFKLPERVARAGASKWVTYRSDKVDPETLRRPRKPINYIHEHNAGVVTYLAMRGARAGLDAGPGFQHPSKMTEVPARFRDDDGALVLLGSCLGFKYDEQEVEGVAPLPDLYCTPDGKCLLVVQSRRTVLAMMWGGALGVFARGIDG